VAGFVAELRSLNVTPHVAQNTAGRRSAIDRRTTRHVGYAIGERVRKRIEEAFGPRPSPDGRSGGAGAGACCAGWLETTRTLRKTRHRGTARVGWMLTLTAAACNLARLPRLLAA
jgi:hypothetical protein